MEETIGDRYVKTMVSFNTLPGYLLRQASNKSMSELGEMLRPYHLTVVEATVLMLIGQNQGCAQRFVGETIHIMSANLTPILSRIEKHGLIYRQKIDGRSKGLYLTDKGQQVFERVADEIDAFETKLLQRIPDHLRANFLEALGHLTEDAST